MKMALVLFVFFGLVSFSPNLLNRRFCQMFSIFIMADKRYEDQESMVLAHHHAF